MKNILICIMALCLTLSFVGCSPEKSNSDGSSSSDGQGFGGDGDGSGDGNGSGGNNPPQNNNCSGTSLDGTGTGTPIHHFNLFLAGKQDWVPGDYDFNDPLISQTMINIQEASLLFQSDSKLQVRFKIHAQEEPSAGEALCFGRSIGMAADQFNYSKLRFYLSLRDVLCDQPNASNPTQCDSGFYLGPRYQTQILDPIAVDGCSNKIDLGHLRNSSLYGTTVEVHKVQSDSTCQANETHCPANDDVRSGSCWRMTMQVSTDYTQSFQ